MACAIAPARPMAIRISIGPRQGFTPKVPSEDSSRVMFCDDKSGSWAGQQNTLFSLSLSTALATSFELHFPIKFLYVSLACSLSLSRSLSLESGGIVLATAYWATSAQGGVTRRGVVLTYRLSLVIGSQ